MRRKNEKSTMRYLGGLSGAGVLKCNGEEIERTTYELDLFFEKQNGVTSNGEIRLSAAALENIFDRQNVQIFTDDGRLLDVRFSGKTPIPESGIAHVDVTGDLKAAVRELHP